MFGLVVKIPVKTALHVGELEFEFCKCGPWEAAVMAKVTESLLPIWETSNEFLPPCFKQSQGPMQAHGE